MLFLLQYGKPLVSLPTLNPDPKKERRDPSTHNRNLPRQPPIHDPKHRAPRKRAYQPAHRPARHRRQTHCDHGVEAEDLQVRGAEVELGEEVDSGDCGGGGGEEAEG